jgi:hypothetical protein
MTLATQRCRQWRRANYRRAIHNPTAPISTRRGPEQVRGDHTKLQDKLCPQFESRRDFPRRRTPTHTTFPLVTKGRGGHKFYCARAIAGPKRSQPNTPVGRTPRGGCCNNSTPRAPQIPAMFDAREQKVC